MFFVLSRAWDKEKKFGVSMRFYSSWGLRFFFLCPTLVARRKTSSSIDFFFWKSRSHTLLLVSNWKHIFLVFVKVLLWLFTIQGTIFIVVQNQWEKFMLKINSYNISLALCNSIFFSGECFIPLYNSLAQTRKCLHCTPCIIQCPYQLLREMCTICQRIFDIVDKRKKHTLQPRTYCG